MIKLLPDVDTGIDDALALFLLSEAEKKGQLEIRDAQRSAEMLRWLRPHLTHSKDVKWQGPKFQ